MNEVFSESDLVASICRDSFYCFLQEFWSEIIKEKPIWNWHIEYLCDEVQQVVERIVEGKPKKYDLVINLPPGETKSTIISVALPIWCWLKLPHFKTIVSTHTTIPLGLNLSRLSRDIVRSEKFKSMFPEFELRKDQDTKGYFINKQGGWRLVATVGGHSPLGLHAHLLVLDDPIDPKSARGITDIKLNEANEWVIQDFLSRKVDKGISAFIMLGQRLHENDPSGFLLKRMGVGSGWNGDKTHAGRDVDTDMGIDNAVENSDKDMVGNVVEDPDGNVVEKPALLGKIRHLCLPADLADGYATVPEELQERYIDGLLDPLRLSRETLREYKLLGEYTYASQYGQSPVPPGGGMFKVDRLVIDDPPRTEDFSVIARFWDKAASAGKGDYTAGVKIGIANDGIVWVLHVERGQWDVEERERTIKRVANSDGERIRIGQEREGGSGGKESAKATVKNLQGFLVETVIASSRGSKIAWAEPFCTQVNESNARLARGDWNQDYIDELRFFFYGTHDDQVDASSGAYQLCCENQYSLHDWIDVAF